MKTSNERKKFLEEESYNIVRKYPNGLTIRSIAFHLRGKGIETTHYELSHAIRNSKKIYHLNGSRYARYYPKEVLESLELPAELS